MYWALTVCHEPCWAGSLLWASCRAGDGDSELSFAALLARALPQMGTDLPPDPSFLILGCPGLVIRGRQP